MEPLLNSQIIYSFGVDLTFVGPLRPLESFPFMVLLSVQPNQEQSEVVLSGPQGCEFLLSLCSLYTQ